MKKALLFIIFLATILTLYFFTPVRGYFSQDGLAVLQTWIQDQGIWAPLVFGFIYIAATVFALPGSVLTIGGGLMFGVWWGTLINWMSASTGAMISFLIARYLGREAVEKILRRQSTLRGLDDKISKNGFYPVFIMRLVPLFPFNALNFGLGLTKVSMRHYALATLLGILPGSFVYTSLGAAGRHIQLSDPATWANVRVWGPFALILLLSFLPKIMRKLGLTL